jgi:hypothetical protein
MTYKFWVECSGNNHNLVKQIIKRRNWIFLASEYTPDHHAVSAYHTEEDDYTYEENTQRSYPNLIWTQMRRPKIMRELQND